MNRSKKMTLALIAGLLVLNSIAALAAPKPKATLCHVGHKEGPNGETYDPNCVPGEDNDYFCADAGKIDLIVVAKANKHLENPSHSYDGIPDYVPADVGASGVGTEDTDGNGIDDGCEPPACPCWAESDLQSVTAENQLDIRSCTYAFLLPDEAGIGNDEENPEVEGGFFACTAGSRFCQPDDTNLCETRDFRQKMTGLTNDEVRSCIGQIARRCEAIGSPIPEPGCDERGFCTVFMTSIVDMMGDLRLVADSLGVLPIDRGGLSSGDNICQKLANDAGIGGSRMYQAWLSDDVESPSTRFATRASVPYERVDGVKVADDWADLTDGSIQATIVVDEDGVLWNAGSGHPWTGTAADGTPDASGRNCTGWRSSNVLVQGLTGRFANTDGRWTDNNTRQCNRQFSPTDPTIHRNYLLCFEQ